MICLPQGHRSCLCGCQGNSMIACFCFFFLKIYLLVDIEKSLLMSFEMHTFINAIKQTSYNVENALPTTQFLEIHKSPTRPCIPPLPGPEENWRGFSGYSLANPFLFSIFLCPLLLETHFRMGLLKFKNTTLIWR